MVEDSFQRQVAIIVPPLYSLLTPAVPQGYWSFPCVSSGPKNNKLYVEVTMSHIIRLTSS